MRECKILKRYSDCSIYYNITLRTRRILNPLVPASRPKFIHGLRFDRSSRTCSPDDGKPDAIDDVLDAQPWTRKATTDRFLLLVVKKTLRDNTWMETLPASDIRMPKRFCFYRICPRVPSPHVFPFSSFTIYPIITLSSHILEPTNAFFLIAFSDYRIVLPRRFLSSLEKAHIANFVNSTVNRDKRNCVSLR